MKKLLQILCIVVFAASLVLAGCGGGGSSPESLAKQTHAEFKKAMKAAGEEESVLAYAMWGLLMMQEPTPAYTKLAEKIEKLSAADQEKFQKEMQKLLGL